MVIQQYCYSHPGDLFSKAAKRLWYPTPIQFRGSIFRNLFPLQTELSTKGNGTPANQSILSVVLSEALVWPNNVMCKRFILPFAFSSHLKCDFTDLDKHNICYNLNRNRDRKNVNKSLWNLESLLWNWGYDYILKKAKYIKISDYCLWDKPIQFEN